MERRQLEYFLAVVAHGGFTSAARALHVSQPSLSHAIASLEGEFGGLLFHRLPHGAVLTPAGEALVRPARQVARDLVTASASVREVLGLESGHLDIVSQTSLAVDPLAGLIAAFVRDHPRVAVRVTDPERLTVEHLVRTGQSELGLLNATPAAADLDGVDLHEQELQLVLPPGSRAGADGRPVTHGELAGLEFVTTPAGTSTRVLLEDAAREAGTRLRIVVEAAHRAMLNPLVLAGAGAALLPGSMAEDAAAKGAVLRAVRPPLRVRTRMVWRRGPLSPAADRFVQRVGGHTGSVDRDDGPDGPDHRTCLST